VLWHIELDAHSQLVCKPSHMGWCSGNKCKWIDWYCLSSIPFHSAVLAFQHPFHTEMYMHQLCTICVFALQILSAISGCWPHIASTHTLAVVILSRRINRNLCSEVGANCRDNGTQTGLFQQVCTASVAKVHVAASWFKRFFKYLNWLFVASS